MVVAAGKRGEERVKDGRKMPKKGKGRKEAGRLDSKGKQMKYAH